VTVGEAIIAAEKILPGQAAPESEVDPRWQAIIEIESYVQDEPEAVWEFALKWGRYEDEDLQAAIATLLVEDLMQHHFDLIFPRIVTEAKSNASFARVTKMCWKMAEAKEPSRAKRFDDLIAELNHDIDR
jgi:hypothetical protein